MKNYLNSKLKIFNLQKKNHYALVNRKFKNIFKKKFFKQINYSKKQEFKKIKNKIKNNYLTSEINDENMSFVFTFAKILKINESSFINLMKSFKGLSHRFEFFYTRKDVVFINDSKATSFASEGALSSLKNIYWILGGLPKK